MKTYLHRQNCQCPSCDPEMAAIMTMDSRQYAGWLNLTQSRMRAAGRIGVFRTTGGGRWHDHEPPDPWDLAGLEAKRLGRTAEAQSTKRRHDDRTPPDSWDIAGLQAAHKASQAAGSR